MEDNESNLIDYFYFEINNLNIKDSNFYFNFITKINSEKSNCKYIRIIKTLSKPNTMQEIYTAFASGIYHIKITTKDGRTINKKFIKK